MGGVHESRVGSGAGVGSGSGLGVGSRGVGERGEHRELDALREQMQGLCDAFVSFRDKVEERLAERAAGGVTEELPHSGAVEPTSFPSTPSTQPASQFSRKPRQLGDGRWELGTEVHSAMVRSASAVVTKLKDGDGYTAFKQWL